MRVEKPPIDKSKEIKKSKEQQPTGKIFFLVILVVVVSIIFWMSWYNVLYTGVKLSADWQNIWTILSCLLAFSVMFSLVGISEVLIEKVWILLVMSLLSGATIFIFFDLNIYTLAACLLLALGFLAWKNEIRVDMKTRIKFMPRKTLSAGLKLAVLLAILSVSFSYYSYLTSGTGVVSGKIIDNLVQSGTKAVNNSLVLFYKDKYNPKMTLDDFIASTTKGIVETTEISGDNEEIQRIFTQSLSLAEKLAVEKAREEFLETFNITASGDDLMEKVIEKIVRKNIDKYIEPYKKFIPPVLTLAVFYLLYIMKFIYQELIKSFSFLLFHILAWMKFIKVKKVQVEVEKIIM